MYRLRFLERGDTGASSVTTTAPAVTYEGTIGDLLYCLRFDIKSRIHSWAGLAERTLEEMVEVCTFPNWSRPHVEAGGQLCVASFKLRAIKL
jgi:hypothetical protein